MKNIYRLFSVTAFALAFSSGAAVYAAAPTPTPTPAPLSDAQVLGVLATANDAEINAGQLAVTRAHASEVKDFAVKMVTDHTANNVKIKEVEVKSGITRQDSDASVNLKKTTDDMINTLKSAKDADFDKSYIDNQVTMHQQLLDALDKTLIPGAQNADIKTYLQDTRSVVDSHLKDAQAIQSHLNQP